MRKGPTTVVIKSCCFLFIRSFVVVSFKTISYLFEVAENWKSFENVGKNEKKTSVLVSLFDGILNVLLCRSCEVCGQNLC